MGKLLQVSMIGVLTFSLLTGCTTSTPTQVSEAINPVSPESSTRTTTNSMDLTKQAKEIIAETNYVDGTYSAQKDAFDEMGIKDAVTVQIKNGNIESVEWNQELQDGRDRRTISKEDPIMVTQGGAQSAWYVQADTTASYFMETKNLVQPDTITGVSIDLDDFYILLNKALEKAK